MGVVISVIDKKLKRQLFWSGMWLVAVMAMAGCGSTSSQTSGGVASVI